MGTGVLVDVGVIVGFGVLVGRLVLVGSNAGGSVLVGDDVTNAPPASAGAIAAASVIGGWGGCVAVGVAAPVDAQPASARQITILVMGVILRAFMRRASQS